VSDGLGRGIDQLALKSVLDGFASIAFAASLGVGVMLSAAVVLVYQGAITLVGEQDNVVGDLAARTIFAGLTSIPIENRDYIVIRSDDHGEPNLKADHLMPLAGERTEANALDWYGPWKLFDGLTMCAFSGQLCERALGNTEFQTFMGRWSDGTPITPAVVTKSPAPPN